MFSNLSFIGKWKQWYRMLRYPKAFGHLHWWGMGSGRRVAEGEDSPCLEWKS